MAEPNRKVGMKKLEELYGKTSNAKKGYTPAYALDELKKSMDKKKSVWGPRAKGVVGDVEKLNRREKLVKLSSKEKAKQTRGKRIARGL